jgi:hypothetical protein
MALLYAAPRAASMPSTAAERRAKNQNVML